MSTRTHHRDDPPRLLGASVGEDKSIGGQSTLEQLADSSCAARHLPLEAPIVDHYQFFLLQHYLQTFNAAHRHRDPPLLTVLQNPPKLPKPENRLRDILTHK